MKHLTKADSIWIDGYHEGYASGHYWRGVEEDEKLCEALGHTLDTCVYPDTYYRELFGRPKGGDGFMAMKELGAGWKRKSTKGTEFVSVSLNPKAVKELTDEDCKRVLMFPNQYKKADKEPDYRLVLSEPKTDGTPTPF